MGWTGAASWLEAAGRTGAEGWIEAGDCWLFGAADVVPDAAIGAGCIPGGMAPTGVEVWPGDMAPAGAETWPGVAGAGNPGRGGGAPGITDGVKCGASKGRSCGW